MLIGKYEFGFCETKIDVYARSYIYMLGLLYMYMNAMLTTPIEIRNIASQKFLL
jgi:hypothetical protein